MTRPTAVGADADPKRDLLLALYGLLARRVWAELEADPTFAPAMRQAEAEFAAGLGILYATYRGGIRRVRRDSRGGATP